MKKSTSFAALLVLGALLVSPSAHAGVQVLTGGVGEGGMDAMKQQEQGYSFKAVYSGQRGIYLSRVNAEIIDSSGQQVVNVVTDGPVLLATLPPGSYTLRSSIGEHEKVSKFKVGSTSMRTLNVSFPIKDTAEYTGTTRSAEPYYDPDYQARGYYPNSYYMSTEWQSRQRGTDNGVPQDSMQRNEYAPPGMAMEGTHAARGKDQQQP
jgi:hypothetical protein